MHWYIGQRVRCVDGAFPRYIVEWCNVVPRAGGIYTIRAIQLGSDPVTGHYAPGFLLEELHNPLKPSGDEAGFFHTRFVPLEDAATAEARETAELIPA